MSSYLKAASYFFNQASGLRNSGQLLLHKLILKQADWLTDLQCAVHVRVQYVACTCVCCTCVCVVVVCVCACACACVCVCVCVWVCVGVCVCVCVCAARVCLCVCACVCMWFVCLHGCLRHIHFTDQKIDGGIFVKMV